MLSPWLREKLPRMLRRWFAVIAWSIFARMVGDVFVARVLALERAQIGDAELGHRDACDRPRKLHRDRRGLALDVGGREIERAVRRRAARRGFRRTACRTRPVGGFPNASSAVSAWWRRK